MNGWVGVPWTVPNDLTKAGRQVSPTPCCDGRLDLEVEVSAGDAEMDALHDKIEHAGAVIAMNVGVAVAALGHAQLTFGRSRIGVAQDREGLIARCGGIRVDAAQVDLV